MESYMSTLRLLNHISVFTNIIIFLFSQIQFS